MTLEEALAKCNTQEIDRRRKHSKDEHNLQKDCVKWFRYQYPQYLIFAIPNGGYRGSHTRMVKKNVSEAALVGAMMRDEGVVAGIPDLCIPVPRQGYAALYIELKYHDRGRVSERQTDIIKRLRGYKNCVVVCRSLEDFIDVVKRYFA